MPFESVLRTGAAALVATVVSLGGRAHAQSTGGTSQTQGTASTEEPSPPPAEGTTKSTSPQKSDAVTYSRPPSSFQRPVPGKHGFLEPKPGKGATLFTPGGEVTFYGNLDLAFEGSTKGISGLTAPSTGEPTPAGNGGWMADISTNLSYIGVRGFQSLGNYLNFVYQLETQLDVAATAGSPNTNSNSGTVVRGALTSRNSYIGLSSPWGALKFGKSDPPYKLSTARMNPFSGMIGDNQVVMSNTGGDNRVEFGTRLDHSIWYESPNLHGLTFSALFSPGQNRSDLSDNIPAGESDCAGGNIPGSGGTGGPNSSVPGSPIACNDGAFSDAFSVSAAYEWGPVYATTAYERHQKVNRNSDIYAIYGVFPLPAAVTGFDTADVAPEDAFKVGAQITLPTKTQVSGIFERMHRYVPSFLEFQNERSRTGFWLAVSQQLTADDSVHFGWAHANSTPGDPGQHNTANFDVGNGGMAGGPNPDNVANLYTAAIKHQLGPNVLAYFTWAMTVNHPLAHYDLGAGGRAVTTDCHDASLPASGDTQANPHCWAGGRLVGVSLGLNGRF
jgi:predicted porin